CILTKARGQALNKEVKIVRKSNVREVASLDGTWQIVFDPSNKGERESWFKKEVFETQKEIVPIHVPSCWEETEQDYEGVAWYGCSFNVPESWKGKVVRIKFGAVNYRAEVWLNDQIVGFHDGGYTPFEFDISDLLQFEMGNFLVVRVIGPIITKDISIDGIGREEAPHWRGAIAGGIWQSVELVATEPIYVRDVFIEPRISESLATIHIEIENKRLRKESILAIFEVFDFGEPERIAAESEKRIKVASGINKLSVDLQIDNPVLWSPENPHLYVSQIRLEADGKIVDLFRTRFGMREFTVKDGDFYLNGEKMYIKAGFWEGFYPTTLAYPPNREFVRKEILLAKQAGFNTLRPWRKPPPSPILDLADELGICVIDCPPIECMKQGPREAPQMEDRIINEVRQLVLRDRNHPSVIYWEIFNEIIRPSLVRLMHKTSLVARSLDPTRVIVDESGGSRSPWGAHIYPPYGTEPLEILEKHRYLRSPVNERDYNYLLTYGEPNKLTFMSEVGYGGLSDLPSNVEQYESEGNPKTPDYRYHKRLLKSLQECMRESSLDEIFDGVSELCLATQELQAVGNKLQLEALRLNPNMDGYCLHAFTGGDWVFGAGIVDLWRNPKKSYFTVQQVNRPIYLAVRATPRNVYAGKRIELKVTALSEVLEKGCKAIIEVSSPNGEQVYRKEKKLTLKTGIESVFVMDFKTEKLSGRYTLSAKLEKDSTVLSENAFSFLVFGEKDLPVPTRKFRIVDPRGLLKSFLRHKGIEFSEFIAGQDSERPVFICTAYAANAKIFEKYIYVFNFVKRGGVAVLLKPPLERLKRNWYPVTGVISYTLPAPSHMLHRTGLFPFRLKTRRAVGNWVPVAHAVKQHPIFEGLPVNCLMGQDYQSVCATETIVSLEGESIVSSISWDWIRNYLGPSNAWWGSDLAIVPYGKGKIILSTLRIIENLGKDPVADKIFYNMVHFAAGSVKTVQPVQQNLKIEVEKYLEKFDSLKGL
ncbi:MAG: hypothetical protein DRO87_11705, partial [Candidatus Thorarchaeota archaeon]